MEDLILMCSVSLVELAEKMRRKEIYFGTFGVAQADSADPADQLVLDL